MLGCPTLFYEKRRHISQEKRPYATCEAKQHPPSLPRTVRTACVTRPARVPPHPAPAVSGSMIAVIGHYGIGVLGDINYGRCINQVIAAFTAAFTAALP